MLLQPRACNSSMIEANCAGGVISPSTFQPPRSSGIWSPPHFFLLLLAHRCLLDERCRCFGVGFRLEPKYRREPSPDRLSNKESHVDPRPCDGLRNGETQTGPIVPFD